MSLILLTGLRSLSSEPRESAAIDGASRWQMFIHITLPLLKPYLLMALLLRTIFEFRAFGNIYATMVLSMFTYLASFVRFAFAPDAAASWMMLLMSMLICLFPLLWVLGLSFKTRLQTFANPPLFLWWPTIENYVDVFGRSDFGLAFVNTLIVSGSAVGLSLCAGVPAAYAFAQFPFRGRSFLFFALLVMCMLPPVAVLVPMYVLFTKLGLTTTHFSVVLAYSTFALPLVVWVMRGFFEDLPAELEESAWIDGASRFTAFRPIVLPLAKPGIVAASILCLQLAWNDFLFAAVLTTTPARLCRRNSSTSARTRAAGNVR